tara:strand:- start:231 stop:485 length:255 start_codon:yes stop_codon:yes gene_type:complete
MVHELPDENGRVQTRINTSRAGYLVSNFDTTESVTVTPQGGGTIDIVLPPGAKVSIPDKIGLVAQGGNSSRNYIFLMWTAGYAN